MDDLSAVPKTYVTFSDVPLVVGNKVIALSGNTDENLKLGDLLVLMYKTWTAQGFQEGLLAERPRIVLPP